MEETKVVIMGSHNIDALKSDATADTKGESFDSSEPIESSNTVHKTETKGKNATSSELNDLEIAFQNDVNADEIKILQALSKGEVFVSSEPNGLSNIAHSIKVGQQTAETDLPYILTDQSDDTASTKGGKDTPLELSDNMLQRNDAQQHKTITNVPTIDAIESLDTVEIDAAAESVASSENFGVTNTFQNIHDVHQVSTDAVKNETSAETKGENVTSSKLNELEILFQNNVNADEIKMLQAMLLAEEASRSGKDEFKTVDQGEDKFRDVRVRHIDLILNTSRKIRDMKNKQMRDERIKARAKSLYMTAMHHARLATRLMFLTPRRRQ